MVHLNFLFVLFTFEARANAFKGFFRLYIEEILQDKCNFNYSHYQAENAINIENGAKIGLEAPNIVYHDESFLFKFANAAIYFPL